MTVKINGSSLAMEILEQGGIKATYTKEQLKKHSENLRVYLKQNYPQHCDKKLFDRLNKIEGKGIHNPKKKAVAIA